MANEVLLSQLLFIYLFDRVFIFYRNNKIRLYLGVYCLDYLLLTKIKKGRHKIHLPVMK